MAATEIMPDLKRNKPRREDLAEDEVLCQYCTAKCCRYFALPIEEPENWKDFEYIRWYLLHDRATVFIEDDSWYLLVHTKCKHLGDDHLCQAYETRPQICRDYTTDKCEYEDDWVYDHYFETPEQVGEYAEAVLPVRKGRTIRSPKPDPLRVIQQVGSPEPASLQVGSPEPTIKLSPTSHNNRSYRIVCPWRLDAVDLVWVDSGESTYGYRHGSESHAT